jgi:CheY-like chemotaxis protein
MMGMRTLNVLVVEDEPSNREIAEIILTSAGHRVTLAADGKEALDLLHGQGLAVDVVLMDILMPVMNGLEATEALRADPRTRDLPIICVSAKASGSDHQTGMAAGCNHYLSKPFKRRQLLESLAKTLLDEGRIAPEDYAALAQGL